MKRLIALLIVTIMLIGCSITYGPYRPIFVSYQGCRDDNTWVNTWSVLTFNKPITNEGLTEITTFLKTENGYKAIVLFNIQRLEK